MTAHEQTMLALVIGLITLAAIIGLAVGYSLRPRGRGRGGRRDAAWRREMGEPRRKAS